MGRNWGVSTELDPDWSPNPLCNHPRSWALLQVQEQGWIPLSPKKRTGIKQMFGGLKVIMEQNIFVLPFSLATLINVSLTVKLIQLPLNVASRTGTDLQVEIHWKIIIFLIICCDLTQQVAQHYTVVHVLLCFPVEWGRELKNTK